MTKRITQFVHARLTWASYRRHKQVHRQLRFSFSLIFDVIIVTERSNSPLQCLASHMKSHFWSVMSGKRTLRGMPPVLNCTSYNVRLFYTDAFQCSLKFRDRHWSSVLWMLQKWGHSTHVSATVGARFATAVITAFSNLDFCDVKYWSLLSFGSSPPLIFWGFVWFTTWSLRIMVARPLTNHDSARWYAHSFSRTHYPRKSSTYYPHQHSQN